MFDMMAAILASGLTAAGIIATADAVWDFWGRTNKYLLKGAYKVARKAQPAYPIKYRHNPYKTWKAENNDIYPS